MLHSSEPFEKGINTIRENKNLYIIAIGASAGGMEAIHLLFDNTPEDGSSYVIIQHLSPDHKSFMAELLAKHSRLKITEAENNMFIKPNCVYLMPKGKNMRIKKRKLYLTDIQAQQPNTAIDIFFDSLAEDQGNKSIAIVLSGTGNDGTKGIAAIKKHGGYVIVQDPKSAKFNGMPISAIESGNVDVVLAPQIIPKEIIAYLNRDVLENTFTDKITEADETALQVILNLIQQHTPLDFSEYRRPTIIRRIVIRMTKNKKNTLIDYIEFLKSNPDEIKILANEFLIGVTKFFRDKEAFQILKEKVIPEIIENKLMVDTLKVWVVGCSTGEEAFSLAILIEEHLTALKKNLEVKIFASDIDKSALLHAAKGLYSENISNEVSEERLEKFFIKKDNKYLVRNNIRKMIVFADHDIAKQPPYGKIDLISCRNLLIYINPLLQKKILTSLHYCLNMGGYLFLGPSESLGGVRKSFSEIDRKWKIFKNIEMVRYICDTTYSTPAIEKQWTIPAIGMPPKKNVLKNNLPEIINQTLLEESGYGAGICVDEEFKIIQPFGNYEKYLLPKIFNFNLLEMLPEELSVATSTTLRKATVQNKKAIIKNVEFKTNGSINSVNICIKPFSSKNSSEQTVFLVLFGDGKTTPSSKKEVEMFNIEEHTLRSLEDLKNELTESKHKLKDAYEALDLSNENISSYNEELISSNEEMQSTNEELQSVNEELQTVNNEYQLKIKELAELNDDLNNFFRGTVNGQLYVDKDHIVRKFTPHAIQQVNLKESDIGRPLSDISTNIKSPTLIEDIDNVINDTIAKEKEIQTNDGRWYQMMIIPYFKQQDNQTDGVIITFNDITKLKIMQEKLFSSNADHDTFIYSASHDLKGPIANLEGLIGLLQETIPSDDEEAMEITGLIDESVKKLKETVTELSSISRIESEINEQENIAVNDLLEEVKLSMKGFLLGSKATIYTDLKEEEILFSKKNLRSILSNLLSNAVKYASPDREPKVTISTVKTDEHIVLSVQDNGLGLKENKIKDLFSKFQRMHTHVEGTGIGLYLTKKIITNAGGKIEIESKLGKGSIFRVYFLK